MASVTFDEFIPAILIDTANGCTIQHNVPSVPSAADHTSSRDLVRAIELGIPFTAKFPVCENVVFNSSGNIVIGRTIINKGSDMWNQITGCLRQLSDYCKPVAIDALPYCRLLIDNQPRMTINVFDVIGGEIKVAFMINNITGTEWKDLKTAFNALDTTAKPADYAFKTSTIPGKYVVCIKAALNEKLQEREGTVTAEIKTTIGWPMLTVHEGKRRSCEITTPASVLKVIFQYANDDATVVYPVHLDCRGESFDITQTDGGLSITAKTQINSFTIKHSWKEAVKAAIDNYMKNRDM